MASVTIQSVKKSFGETAVLHGVDIDIADGSFTVLVGPSGCGKSTLLRMIAGLEEISSGEIRIGERRVNDVPPKERDIAMVFQNYALYPHMTVRQNLAFSLMLAKQDKATIDQKVGRAAEILALSALMDRYPRQLSGGQRQRVAMGRAIVRDPQVFLYDEPLSNLDAKLRVAMRSELKELHQRLKTTSVYVTHDQIEAMTMGDRIVVMKDGRIEQVGSPLDLYDHPDQRLRRRLHRLAFDELRSGDAAPPGRRGQPRPRRRHDAGGAARRRRQRRPAGRPRHAPGAPAPGERRRHRLRASSSWSRPAPTPSWPAATAAPRWPRSSASATISRPAARSTSCPTSSGRICSTPAAASASPPETAPVAAIHSISDRRLTQTGDPR